MKVLKTFLAISVLGTAAVAAVIATGDAGTEDTPASAATVSLHVEGMTCASCKVAVRTVLSKLDGVKDARADVATKSATIDYDPTRVTPQQMVDAVNRLGYPASLPAKGGS